MPLELDQIYESLDELNVALGPTGANRNGALSRPARDHRRELRRPGRAVPPDHPGLQQVHARPSTTTRRSCSAPPARWRASSAPSPRTTRPCASSTSRWPRCRPCWPASAGAAAPHCATSPWRWARCPRSSRTTARSSAATSRASTGWPGCWSSSAAPSTRSSSAAPLALNNLYLTYNPQAGTLDTRVQPGRGRRPDRDRPGGVPLRHRRPGRHLRRGLRRRSSAAARAGAGAGRRLRPGRSRPAASSSTRPSAASWRCER